MSTRITQSVEIACTPRALYDYVTQPWRWHEWHPASRSASAAGDTLAVGDGFDEIIEIQPLAPLPLTLRRETHYTVVSADPPSSWQVEGRTRDGWLRIEYTLQACEAGTRFQRTLSYQVTGVTRLLVPLMRSRMVTQSLLALERLKARMEQTRT
jgi:hypothetical protein